MSLECHWFVKTDVHYNLKRDLNWSIKSETTFFSFEPTESLTGVSE